MSRKKIVAGNWKMNMTIDESNDLINKLKEVSKNNVEIKIAPSFTNLYYTISLLKNSGIEVIAQNVHSEKSGAYTGEISTEMLKSIGVNTVIIGHSERRKYFNETDTILSKKVKAALENSLNVIFCIGEVNDCLIFFKLYFTKSLFALLPIYFVEKGFFSNVKSK